MKKGKLIVIEGTDGSGKSTQFSLLTQHVTQMGQAYQRLVFPQYQEPSSALVRMYLQGEFGTAPDDVNPYAASTFYAVDRYASYKKVWGTGYGQGDLILSDRYTTSNAVHQTGKLPEEEWVPFLEWLMDLEYHKLELPRPDLVLWLDMPTDKVVELLRQREDKTHTKADIHEVDEAYLARCRQVAATAAQVGGWKRIPSVDDHGTLRSQEEIHQEIWALVQPFL